MSAYVLVTRPEPEATHWAEMLSAAGMRPLLAPMLIIHPLPQAKDAVTRALEGAVEAIAITSRHALPTLPATSLPVYVVGEDTAQRARTQGLQVAYAAPTVQALLPHLPPKVLYVRGRDITHPLPAAYEVVVYAAEPASHLPPDAHVAWGAGQVHIATFFSAHTAHAFVECLRHSALEAAATNVRAVAISAAAAEPLRSIPWKEVRIAAEPSASAMLASCQAP